MTEFAARFCARRMPLLRRVLGLFLAFFSATRNCERASSAKAPSRATSSSKPPASITRPSRNTTMRVALRMVASRCAITKVVRSFITSSSAACTLVSVWASSAEVASSRIRIGGFFKKRAGDRQPLTLAAGQETAALADDGVQACRGCVRRNRAPGRARSASSISSSVASGLPRGEILADRAVEQQHFLEHHADVPAQRRELHLAQVDAVDGDAAGLRIEDAMQQRQRRGLAGAGRSDQRDHFARAARANSGRRSAARLPS